MRKIPLSFVLKKVILGSIVMFINAGLAFFGFYTAKKMDNQRENFFPDGQTDENEISSEYQLGISSSVAQEIHIFPIASAEENNPENITNEKSEVATLEKKTDKEKNSDSSKAASTDSATTKDSTEKSSSSKKKKSSTKKSSTKTKSS